MYFNSSSVLNAFYDSQKQKFSDCSRMQFRIPHIYNVANHAAYLTVKERITNAQGEALITAALLHDHFQILQLANSVEDPHANHADLEVLDKTLFANGRFEEYFPNVSAEQKARIRLAISAHAAKDFILPENTTCADKRVARLLRDADQMALVNAWSNPVDVLKGWYLFDDDEINRSVIQKEVFEAAMTQRELIDFAICQTPADRVIQNLMFIYDTDSDFAKKAMAEDMRDVLPYNLGIFGRIHTRRQIMEIVDKITSDVAVD
jgi:hypothetical protein